MQAVLVLAVLPLLAAAPLQASFWCPGQCSLQNSPLCGDSYLFVIGTGRSGSTSIFKALNLVRGVHLCGETGVLPAFRDLYRAVSGSSGDVALHSTRQLMTLLEDQQRLFKMLHPPTSHESQSMLIVGSKEVHVPMDQLDFVMRLFPCSRFIFSFRKDILAQGNSGFHKKDNTSLQVLTEERQKMFHMHGELGENRAYLLALEDLNTDNINRLLDWMGYDDCRFMKVGHYNFNNTYRKIKARPRVKGKCIHRATTLHSNK